MYAIRRVWPENTALNAAAEKLLSTAHLRRDPWLDYLCVVQNGDDVVAVGGCFQNTLRCLAVREDYQGEGLMNQVVSHLLNVQMDRGNDHVFLCTKCSNVALFATLGFYEVARAGDDAALMENRPTGFADYCAALRKTHEEGKRAAAVVINANPFTLGHRALIERACEDYEEVHVFMVSENLSLIPFSVRSRLIRQGIAGLEKVRCHSSGPYLISGATFPSYFLRDDCAPMEVHARMDVEIFKKIAAAAGINARFVGEEPTSQVTGLYNRVLSQLLPPAGIACVTVPRKTTADGEVISASTVRRAMRDGNWALVQSMVPPATWEYFQLPESAAVVEAIRRCDNVEHH